MAIKNTHNTTKISSIDHEEQSPIIIQNNSIDQAIYEAEQEIFDGESNGVKERARNAKEEKGSDEIENKRNCENKKKDEARLELYSLLGQGYKAMQEGCESSIDEVKERIYFNE